MNFIEKVKEKARKNIKKIVLPETMDRRVIEAGVKATEEKIAEIIFIGNEREIANQNPDLDLSQIAFIDPNEAELTVKLTEDLYELRKNKGMTLEEAKNLLLTDYMYYACMLVKENLADGVVSGACHSTANTLRPSLQIIKTDPNSDLVSAFFLMVVPNCEFGSNGTFIFADSGLVQNPSSQELKEQTYMVIEIDEN